MDQRTNQDQDRPNQNANKEPAEGSRETTGADQSAGGITNRPLAEEQKEQDEVPPRGQTKDEKHNATGSERDPVMPQDDATLKTKI